MSDHHHAPQPWFERFWQPCLIGFAIVLVIIFATYAPTNPGSPDASVTATHGLADTSAVIPPESKEKE